MVALVLVTAACSGDGTTPAAAPVTSATAVPATAAVGPTSSAPSPSTQPTVAAPTTGGRPVTSGASTTTVAGTPVRLGRGVTDKTITLGFMESSDVGAANAAVGGSSARPGETSRKDYAEPLINWFNKHGGIAGRKIVAVWADDKVAPNNTRAGSRQAACATYTQDNKVFAAQILPTTLYPDLLECMKQAGSILVVPHQNWEMDSESFQRWPDVYFPVGFELGRKMKLFADNLFKVGYFEKGARIGLVYNRREGAVRAVDSVLKPALKAHGLTVSQEFAFTPTESVDSLAQTETEAQTAVLRFKAAGITHVLAVVNAFVGFGDAAEQQNYHPRYGLTSTSSFTAGSLTASSGPQVQAKRAVLMSWTYQETWDETIKRPEYQQCVGAVRAEGHPAPRDSLFGQFLVQHCDYLFFMKHTLEGARDFSLGGFARAVATRPGPVNLIQTYVTNFRGGRHDGVAAIRMAEYDYDGCGCFKYTTGPIPV